MVQDEEEADQPVAPVEFETNAAPASTFSDPTASFADLNEDAAPVSDFQEVDFNIVASPESPSD
jgi:hypothetical protein